VSPECDLSGRICVVGNPSVHPYDDVPDDAAGGLPAPDSPTMVGRGDIYVGFIEAGLRQLKDGGVLGFHLRGPLDALGLRAASCAA